MSAEHTNWDDDPYIGSDAYQRELAAIDALPDDEIDYSDIPPLTDEQLTHAIRGKYVRPREGEALVPLDADVIAWFRRRYPKYQTAMNAALRSYMETHTGEQDDPESDLRKTA